MLWLLEGITSYYGTLTQVRAGLRPGDSFWRSMAGQIRTLESSAAREHVSSSEASWRVWDPKPSDRSLNYYNSGLVLGFLLDVEIRASSRNTRSLDDLMRGLYTLCEDRGRGFDDRDVPRLVRELAGRSYDAWFDAHVSGTVVPDYATTLAKAGLTYHEERVRRNVIRGISSAGAGETRHAWWTDPDASGRRARFRQGRVVAVGDTKTEGYDAVVAAIDAATSGSTVALGIVRTDGTEVDIEVTLDSVPRCRVEITLDADADAAAVAIREGLLAGEPSRAGF
jgi:predicted metalloprotease with PDZ domain